VLRHVKLRLMTAELRTDEALRLQQAERERAPERPRLDGRWWDWIR